MHCRDEEMLSEKKRVGIEYFRVRTDCPAVGLSYVAIIAPWNCS